MFFNFLSNFIINQVFNYAPYKRALECPVVIPMEEEIISTSWERGGEITVVAVAKLKIKKSYVISAAVDRAAGGTFNLQTERKLVPIDLFLGWGIMSSPFSARMFDYRKIYGANGGRTIEYQSDGYKVSRAFGHCAHVHIMNPNDVDVPKRGDCIAIEGYLVDIYIDKVCTWPTDLIIGDQNCETIYPEKIEILK